MATTLAIAVVGAWMNCRRHRGDLLSDRYEVIGVGIACAPGGTAWVTQNFGALRSHARFARRQVRSCHTPSVQSGA